jgi:hypothetical protein
MCVCLCVCLCVCPAIRFHISQRIFFKFGGSLLRAMIRSMGYICFVCKQCARTRVRAKRAHMCAFAYFERILSKFAGNILQLTTRVRAGAWLRHALIYGQILFKCDGHILHMTTSDMRYILIMFKHRVHACERACASARVIKCSLISEWILVGTYNKSP